MRRSSAFLAALLAGMLALAPGLADARAGGGASMGSRGSHTWSSPPTTRTAPFSAAPMERSDTPRTQPNYAPYPGYAPAQPGYGAAAPYGRRSAFTSGLLGGLIGAGLGGLLFGHGLFGGLHGGFSFIGLLLQIGLIVLLVRFLFRTFGSGLSRFASSPDMAGAVPPRPAAGGFGGGAGGAPITVGRADYQQFEQILRNVQAAWSAQDLGALRRLATPEMVGYFSEQLSEQASRGVRNTVTDVRLERGDLAEAWSEGGREYATVAMRFSMVDATYDAAGRVVDGSPTERMTATELWTFLRAPGGGWVLSAIQQAR
ncbi:MAG TPA: TIM44-like domain-containing protein [Acetobacteraceae bacterium]|nr:TIM44-like domain-containing protein [Acetobacteraceae bacterium]